MGLFAGIKNKTIKEIKGKRPDFRRHQLALEARMMFDGAAVVSAADALDRPSGESAPDQTGPTTPAATAEWLAALTTLATAATPAADRQATEIVFIDARLGELGTLLQHLDHAVEVVRIAADRDGLVQIEQRLANRHDIAAIHLIGHGSAGEMTLGTAVLDEQHARTVYRDALATLGQALAPQGDLLLYGCAFGAGEAGQAAVATIAALTGADVSASVDTTGSTDLGGNWVLERTSGSIESATLDGAAWHGLLAAPVISDSVAATRVAAEDTALTLRGLSVADSDGQSQTVTLTATGGATLTLATTAGLSGVAGNGSGSVSFTGTLAQVNTALDGLVYRPADNANGPATFVIGTSDGSGGSASRTVQLSVAALNDAPVMAAPTVLSVSEGGSASFAASVVSGAGFTEENLGLSDIDNTPLQVIIKVTALPAQGILALNGNELAIGSTLSAADIGSLRYTHNASQVTAPAGAVDSFGITVDDGAGGLLTNQTVSVRIMPVNQAPVPSGAITLVEGELDVRLDNNGLLPSPLLRARGAIGVSDADSETITTYRITGLPIHGVLRYNGTVIAAASVGTPFVVTDLSRLTYSHDGSESTADSFTVSVTDAGGGAGTPLSASATIDLVILPNNDDPTLSVNVTPSMLSGTSSIVITPAMLTVADVDSPASTLTYTITAVPDPSLGFFVFNGQSVVAGATFSQADINAGGLSYVAATIGPRTDSLSFTVKDGDMTIYPAPRDGGIHVPGNDTLQTQTFRVNVPATVMPYSGAIPASMGVNTTPSAGGTNAGSLLESGSMVLDNTVLLALDPDNTAAQLVYRLLTLPSSGTVTLDGVTLSSYASLTQQQVNEGRIRFVHGGGESFVDEFRYSVSDGKSETTLRTVALSTTPQNDTPVASVGTSRLVLQETTSLAITDAHLRLTDADNSLSDNETGHAIDNTLRLRITGTVSHGNLTLNGINVVPGVTEVSSAELAAGILVYQHDGSENYNDSLRLVPVDDQGITVATATNRISTGAELTMAITITPVNDTLMHFSTSHLTTGQGGPVVEGGSAVIGGASAYATLNGLAGSGTPTASTGAHLVYADDDNTAEQRQYRITTGPTQGVILSGTRVLASGSVFTQGDLDSGLIRYRHTGGDLNLDHFEYLVSDGDFVASDVTQTPQGSTPAPARFNIEITATNDAAVVTAPSGTVIIDSSSPALNPVSGFTVADSELDILDGSEIDFIQVSVRLTQSDGTPFSAADYAAGGGTQLTVTLAGATVRDAGQDGVADALVLRGTRADVNTTLASLGLAFPDDRDAAYRVEVIADDRLRDAGGTLLGGANGGSLNQAVVAGDAPTAVPLTAFDLYTGSVPVADPNLHAASVVVRASSVNDPAVLTGPGGLSINEDLTTLVGGWTVSDAESDTFDLPVTVTLSLPAGQGILGIGGSGSQSDYTVSGRQVTIGGDNTTTLTLTGRAGDIQSLLNHASDGLTYSSSAHANHDANGAAAGDVTLTTSFNDAGAAIGGDVGSGSVSANPPDVSTALTLVPTNDAPVVSAALSTVEVISAGMAMTVSSFMVVETDYTDGGNITTGETDFVQVMVRLADTSGAPIAASLYTGSTGTDIILSSGTAPAESATFEIDNLWSGSGKVLLIRGTLGDVNAYLAGLSITVSGALINTDQTYRLEIIADDRLRDVLTGTLDPSLTANGGGNPDGADAGLTPDAVPVTVLDPYSAVPGELAPNIGVAYRQVFFSGINDPARINANNVTVTENAATLDLTAAIGAFTVTDPDSNGTAALSATITLNKGTVSGVGGSGGTATGIGTATVTLNGLTQVELNSRLQALTITFPDEAGAATASDWNGSLTVTVAVNDGGRVGERPVTLAGDTNDSTTNPGDFSHADGVSANLVTTRTITVTVTAVNDAPTRLDGTAVTLTPVAEDTANPPGSTVASLFGPQFQDTLDSITGGSSANALAGVAITTNNAIATQGQWQYSPNGITWTALPAVSTTSALILKSTDLLRFVPAADFHGTPGTLVTRLIDDSLGAVTTGTTANVSTSGGVTRFSNNANSVTLTTSITAVNDAPTLGAASLSAIGEDVSSAANAGATVSSLWTALYADATDNRSAITGGGNTSTALSGLAILANTADPLTQGTWQYSVSAGVWVDLPQGADLGNSGSAVLLPTTASLRFQPAVQYNGTPPTLGVSALDLSSGSAISSVQTAQTITTLGGTTRFSALTTLSATVSAFNDAPTLSGLTGTPVYTESTLVPVALDTDGVVTVADLDLATHWSGVTLTIERQGGAAAQDVFSLIDSAPGNPALGVEIVGADVRVDGVIVGTQTTAAGRLLVTFNTNADAARVGSVIGALGYRNTSDTPPAQAVISVVLDDQNPDTTGGGTAGTGQNQGGGGHLGVTATVTVDITAVNDAPLLTGLDPTGATVHTENGPAILIDADATLTDAELDTTDWRGAALSLARHGGADATDVFGGSGTLSFSGAGTGDVLLAGTPIGTYTQTGGQLDITWSAGTVSSQVQQVLRSLTYRYDGEDPPASVTLTLTANDANTGTPGTQAQGSGGALATGGNITLTLTPVNDPVVVSAAPTAPGYTEQGVPIPVDPGLTLADPDDTQLASATVSLTSPVSGDLLAVTTTGTSITALYDAMTGVLTLSGTDSVAHYQDVLRSLVYSSSSDDPTVNGTRPSVLMSMAFTDANSDGAGAQTSLTTRSLDLTADNDAPVLAGLGNVGYTENAPAIAVAPGLTLSDLDDTAMTAATVQIMSGLGVGDRLQFVDQNGIVGIYTAGTGTLTLTGTATRSQYEAALRSVSFDSPSDDPGATTRTLSWRVTDADSDGAGARTSLVGTSTVEVTPVNDAPVAINDTASRLKTDVVAATGSVLTNDSDPLDGGTLSVTALVGGTPGTPLVRPTGTLTLNSDGSYTFAVNRADPAVAALGTGQTLVETYTYTTSDGQGGSTTATLTVTLNGVNDAPTAVADAGDLNEDGAPLTVAAPGLLGNDRDLNPGDSVTVNAVAAGAGQPIGGSTAVPGGGSASLIGLHGTLTLHADGHYTYALDVTDPAIQALSVGQSTTDSFTCFIRDIDGATASSDLVLTIHGVNDAPTATADVASMLMGTGPVSTSVLGNDSDPDSADVLRVSAVNANPLDVGQPVIGTHGSLTLRADGTCTYVPNSTTAAALPAGAVVTDVFSYTVSDGQGGTANATITLTVTGINDAPTVIASAGTTAEDAPLDGSVTLSDIDGDPVTATLTTAPAHGTVTVNPDGTYRYTPDADYNGPDSFVVTASDGNGGLTSSTVNLTVTPVNDAPTLAPQIITTTEDTLVQQRLPLQDVDGDVVHATLTHPALHGNVILEPDGSCTYAPGPDFNGQDTFTVTLSDGHGGQASATVQIVVTPVNDAPVAVTDTVRIPVEATPVRVDVLGNDHDPDGDVLSVVSVETDSGTVSVDADGFVIYQSDALDTPPEPVRYVVSDGHGGFSIGVLRFESTERNPLVSNTTAPNDPALTLNDPAARLSDLTAANGTDQADGAVISSMNRIQSLQGITQQTGRPSVLPTARDASIWGNQPLLGSASSDPKQWLGLSLQLHGEMSSHQTTLLFDTQVNQTTIQLTVRSNQTAANQAIEYQFLDAKGRQLPAWMHADAGGTLTVSRVVGVEAVEVTVRALHADGTVLQQRVIVQDASGAVQILQSSRSIPGARGTSLSHTLSNLGTDLDQDTHRLVKALATRRQHESV